MAPGLERILAQNWEPSTLRGMNRNCDVKADSNVALYDILEKIDWWGQPKVNKRKRKPKKKKLHIKRKADRHDIACECQKCMDLRRQLKKMKQDVDH